MSRGLKIRRRRRRRQRKHKNNNPARATHSFVYFLALVARLQLETAEYHLLSMEDVSKADEIFLFFLKLDVHGS